jgi:signal transduction histidine kinase/ActR/RegA family two-component response regulator
LTEVIGQNPNILKSGQHPPAFYADLWQTVTSGRTWEGELCNRRKDRTTYYERMTIAPVRDSGGVIAHFVAMMEDITGQHELEQQLNRSQRLESIGLLASGIAHDLNNMLAPILLSVGLIGSRHQDRETRELLDMMQTAAQRGAGVVQQVLTFARGVEGARTELDVSPLLKELAQLARETFPREIRVAVEVPKLPLLVEGDVTQLHQVLLNLAVNARDAMHDGGVLRLKAESVALDATAARLAPAGKAGDYVKLSVADTGTGIPSEIVDHIFEPFFTTKPRGKGTGLGLSTVFGIVRSHGGFVTVESTLGQGTVFSVLLPRRSAPPTPETKSVAATPAVNGAGRCVLIVDDEASIRLATAEVLKRHGYTVAKAEDGFEALRRLRENPEGFALALVDLMMPGMSGYKLIPELRRLAPRLPVVVVSGMTGDGQAGENRSVLLAAGVRTILDKPFNEAALLEALDVELSVPEYPG